MLGPPTPDNSNNTSNTSNRDSKVEEEDNDEGLGGDICGTSEASASPQPLEDKDSKIDELAEKGTSEDAMRDIGEVEVKAVRVRSTTTAVPKTAVVEKQLSSPADERMPSRIALSVETKL